MASSWYFYFLKFVPHETLILFLCDLIKENWTSKTETRVDDDAVDDVLGPVLNNFWNCAINSDITWRQTILENALLAIDFLDETALSEVSAKIKQKQDKLLQSSK
jgi:hypothetical protein